VAVETHVEGPVVRVSGELDITNVGSLEEVLAPVLSATTRRLVFELSGLQFLDSTGLGVLLTCRRQVPEVVLRDPSEIVRQVIEATGLTRVLRMEP
jgi:anti-sigma B factor antagonist